MGYHAHQVDSNFFIANKDLPQVVKAIHNIENTDYAWVDFRYRQTDDLKQIFFYWRWNVHFDTEQNIIDIAFDREKLGDDEVLFQAIAPFVREKSYIQMSGEDDAMWRWVFINNRMVEVYPEITWNY